MNVLQIIAHPDPRHGSFCHQLADKFHKGADDAKHWVRRAHAFDGGCSDFVHRLVTTGWAEHINFVYPCWWEMPPAKLVDLLQTVFVRDMAFKYDEKLGRMTPTLNIPVTCFITLGQDKDPDLTYLGDAMRYCGLHPSFHVCSNVGPRMTPALADAYLTSAYNTGFNLQGQS
jgi:putative NADPH-quinone reductase